MTQVSIETPIVAVAAEDKDGGRDWNRDRNRDGDKDKSRDWDRDKERDKDRDKDKDKDRWRDRDKDRDKDKDKDKDKDRYRDRDRGKHKGDYRKHNPGHDNGYYDDYYTTIYDSQNYGGYSYGLGAYDQGYEDVCLSPRRAGGKPSDPNDHFYKRRKRITRRLVKDIYQQAYRDGFAEEGFTTGRGISRRLISSGTVKFKSASEECRRSKGLRRFSLDVSCDWDIFASKVLHS